MKHLEIKTEQVLPENGKLRIVQISDVHVGIIIRGNSLTPILESVKRANPDILVSTGDLLDGELDNIMQDAAQFAAIKAKYGKFAVLGNHEYYAGLDALHGIYQSRRISICCGMIVRHSGRHNHLRRRRHHRPQIRQRH
ncbi:MAG: metallophosphoesterase [Rhodopseudomonas palustris]|nr:metallophosphoesterase [Rhodopseudomonas palustris]